MKISKADLITTILVVLALLSMTFLFHHETTATMRVEHPVIMPSLVCNKLIFQGKTTMFSVEACHAN